MWISSTATCTGFLVFYPSPFPRMSLLHHINPAINPTSSRSRKRSLQSKVEKFRHAMLCFTLSENPHIELQIFTKTCRSEFGLLYCFEFVMQVSVRNSIFILSINWGVGKGLDVHILYRWRKYREGVAEFVIMHELDVGLARPYFDKNTTPLFRTHYYQHKSNSHFFGWKLYILVLQKLYENYRYFTYLDFSSVLQWALADMAFCLVGCFNGFIRLHECKDLARTCFAYSDDQNVVLKEIWIDF